MSGGPIPIDGLNEEEKEKVRYHLGYLETSLAPSIQLGIPKPTQTLFLLEDGLGLLRNGFACNRARCILKVLDELEVKLVAGVSTLVASNLGTMKLHPLAAMGQLYTDSLEKEYRRWAGRLADIFGVPIYPFSQRFKRSGPGTSITVR